MHFSFYISGRSSYFSLASKEFHDQQYSFNILFWFQYNLVRCQKHDPHKQWTTFLLLYLKFTNCLLTSSIYFNLLGLYIMYVSENFANAFHLLPSVIGFFDIQKHLLLDYVHYYSWGRYIHYKESSQMFVCFFVVCVWIEK